MLPWVLWVTAQARRPFRLVEIAQAFSRRHAEAIVKQAYVPFWRLTFLVGEFNPADLRLAAERKKSMSSAIGSPSSAVTKRPSLLNLISRPTIDDGATSSMYRSTALRVSTAVVAGVLVLDIAGTLAGGVAAAASWVAAGCGLLAGCRAVAAWRLCSAMICSGVGGLRFGCVSMGMMCSFVCCVRGG